MGADRERLLERVRATRRRLTETGPPAQRAPGDFALVSLPPHEGDALRDLLVRSHVRTVVEIGLAYAGSTLAIAEALLRHDAWPVVSHLVVDPFQQSFSDAGWQAMEEAGLTGYCTLARERSQLLLPRLVAENFVADAAFVDGSHLFHNVFVDLYFLGQVVVPGGLVVLDDCQWPSVAAAAEYFETNLGWTPVPVPGSVRLRAYRLPDPASEPRFEDFKPFGAGASGASAGDGPGIPATGTEATGS